MKIKQTLILAAIFIGIGAIFTSPIASAETCVKDPKDNTTFSTSVLPCGGTNNGTVEDSGIWGLLILAVNILSAGVVIAAIGGVVYGSIMYTTSGGSVEQTKKARAIIANTIVGIVLYVAMWAFLNYIVPGGVFTTPSTSTLSTTPSTSTPSSPTGAGGGFSSGSGTGSSTGGGGGSGSAN